MSERRTQRTVPCAALAAASLALFLSAFGCERGPTDGSPAAPAAPPAATRDLGFQLVTRTDEAGIRFRHTDGSSGRYFITETVASGVGLFDYDGDGDLDIYFPNGRPLPATPEGNASASNALYRNDGDGTFTDVTRDAGVPGVGYSIGVCAGDYDGDGDLDLYVTGLGNNVLYRNNGDGTFTDVTAAAGVNDTRLSLGSSFVDIDGDGDLDLYVANYCADDFVNGKPCLYNGIPNYCTPAQYPPYPDSLFENLGRGTFRDISHEAGIDRPAKWGMGVLATDYNSDGRIDIFVANDVSENFLWENLGGGRFRNVALEKGVALNTDGDEQGSMGIDTVDYDHDGNLDIIVTNYQKQLNALYHCEGSHGFADLAMVQGLGQSSLPLVSWGTGFYDLDNDGWEDLFFSNGHIEDRIEEYDQSTRFRQYNQVFRNLGNGKFDDVSDSAGPALRELMSSRGAAFGDIDNDGDIDIVLSNIREKPSLIINEGGNRRSWIELELRGKKNVFAIGARVRIVAGASSQMREVRTGHGYASQSDLRLHFGLGDAERVDRVEIRWPDGKTSVHEGLEARRLHRIEEP